MEELSTSEGRLRLSSLETKSERRGWDGLDVQRKDSGHICSSEEGKRTTTEKIHGSWTRTHRWLVWQRRICSFHYMHKHIQKQKFSDFSSIKILTKTLSLLCKFHTKIKCSFLSYSCSAAPLATATYCQRNLAWLLIWPEAAKYQRTPVTRMPAPQGNHHTGRHWR